MDDHKLQNFFFFLATQIISLVTHFWVPTQSLGTTCLELWIRNIGFGTEKGVFLFLSFLTLERFSLT